MLTTTCFQEFCDDTLDAIASRIAALDDASVNLRLPTPGSNSPYAIVTHCMGVMAFWARQTNLGHDVHRRRDAEFSAAGSVDALLDALSAARSRFTDDVLAANPDAPPRKPSQGQHSHAFQQTQGSVLMHVYEELTQHLGQLEITADLIAAGFGVPATGTS